MAVQGLFRRVQRGKAQTAARGTGGAELRADAFDKALSGIFTGSLKLGLHAVDLGYGRRRHRPRCRFYGAGRR